MYRFSNTTLGYLNLLTLLSSIPLIGAGLWMTHSSSSLCTTSLQTPVTVIGFIILLVSLAGFVGSCFHIAFALWLYLFFMFLLILALLILAIFGLAVTTGGGGHEVPGREYREYRLGDYSGWLRHKIEQKEYWNMALGCIVGSKACADVQFWSPVDFLQRDLTPVQSGCCKPPTSCAYNIVGTMVVFDEDCYRWSNDSGLLCYRCNSCKAGVLEQVRRDWHNISVLNIVVVVFLMAVYAIGCCAFRNVRRAESEYPHSTHATMSKIHPRWDYHWLRWIRDRREDLY
ncbi:tetraspanin-6-like [Carex rostrata]